MAVNAGSPQFAVTPPKSQVDGTPTIGAGHPSPVQAPPLNTGLAAGTTNSATGSKSNNTPSNKKHDSAS